MELQDPKKLKRLMIVQGISQRELARIAGWKTHSYLGRLLSGEAKTLNPDPALRIAFALQVGVEDLFLTKVSTPSGQSDRSTRTRSGAKSQSRTQRKVAA